MQANGIRVVGGGMRWGIMCLVVGLASTASAQDLSDLVRRGRHAEALERLAEVEGELSLPHRYLRARLLERTGGNAIDAYALTGLPPSVQADVAFRRGRLLAFAGRCDEAKTALDSLPASRRRPTLRGLVAQCRLRSATNAEQLTPVIAELRAIAGDDPARVDTFAIRLSLVEALERAGDADASRRELRSLYVDIPAHPDADQVARRLGTIELTPTEKLRRAQRWFDARRFRDAVAELEADPPRAHRAAWLHLRGMSRYRSRNDYLEASQDLSAAARAGGATAIDDEFHAARALSRADRDAEAIRAYRRFVRRHRRHSRAHHAEYLAAWLEDRLGRATARRSFQRFLRRARGNLKRNATWHVALGDYRRRRFSSAAALFEQYAGTGSGPMVEGRGLYWAGRSFEAAGNNRRALAYYRRVRAIDPLHWYGLHAAQRMAGLGSAEPIPLLAAGPAPESLTVTLPAEVAFYNELGLWRDALRELRSRERALRRSAPRGRTIETLVAMYTQVGGARRSYQLGNTRRSELRQEPEGSARWAWDAAYPRPFFGAVREAARANNLPWEHLYATMRQESGYSVDAVSRADAIGLLQVLPSSGRRIARRRGLPFARDRLFEPRHNIQLGAAEIAGEWNRFRLEGTDVQPLVIAAYNAGGARVERWLNETGTMDLDLFVELIPFDETRNYVRRVSSHFARYRYAATRHVVTLPARVSP